MVYLRKTELSQLHRVQHKKNYNINNVLKALALKSFQVQKTAIAKTKKGKKENKHSTCMYIYKWMDMLYTNIQRGCSFTHLWLT